jgi:hypothetical protein
MKMPAGEYYVGDPCYVIPDDEWSDLLDHTLFFGLFASPDNMAKDIYNEKANQNGIFSWKDKLLGVSSTAYGDGGYSSNVDKSFSVDAGMIGAVPLELCDPEGLEEVHKYGHGHVMTFDHDFSIEYDDGTICIGEVEIYTGDRDEDEEDWDY